MKEPKRAFPSEIGKRVVSTINDKAFEDAAMAFVEAEKELQRTKVQMLTYLNLNSGTEMLVEVDWSKIRAAGYYLLDRAPEKYKI